MLLLLIVGSTLLSGTGSAALAALALFLPEPRRHRLTPFAVSYATGTLLGAALLGLLPHALQNLPAHRATATVLVGIVSFFLLERLAVWRHCHAGKCEIHSSAATLILLGDALHNFVDGVAIAVAFLASVPLGIATAVAVAAHEIPQEIGDFFILLEGGFTRKRAFAWNLVSSSTALAGGLAAYAWILPAKSSAPYVMAFSAASFIYIALADLIPGHRRETSLNSVLQQFGLIGGGIGTILLLQGVRG